MRAVRDIDWSKYPGLRVAREREAELQRNETPEQTQNRHAEEAEHERLTKEFERGLEALRRADAPRKARAAWESGLRQTPSVEAVRDWLRSGETFLLLTGGVGAGKTVAACEAIARKGGRFLHAVDAARMSMFGTDAELAIDRLQRACLLVLDDLGVEMLHDGWKPTLDRLIDYRQDADKRTVLTTNLTVDEFRQRYGERLFSRVSDSGTVWKCGDVSLRGAR